MTERPPVEADPRIARVRTHPRKFLLLLVELLLVLAVVKLFRIEETPFLQMATLAVGGFAVHYWLPLRWKEWFWIALSLGGTFLFFAPLTAAALLAVALVLFAISRAPWSYPVRVGAIVAVGTLCTLGRCLGGGWLGLPDTLDQLWPVLGSVFLFRLIIWTYDLKHAKSAPTPKEFLAYFFMLPNWACLLFPVVNFRTQRNRFFARDIHEVAQEGVEWMARGVVHLLLYRVVYYNKPAADPATVTSLGQLLLVMVTTFLLYMRISGLFHFAIGVLHLFGYDLPETNHRYFLASSLTDFWRRINIYWKDFMVKVVYYPVYFRLRRRGDVSAQVIATLVVFIVTFALHAWQDVWLKGRYVPRGPDMVFWGILGSLMVMNLLVEIRSRSSPRPAPVNAGPSAGGNAGAAARGSTGGGTEGRTAGGARLVHAAKVAGTFLLLSVLWSMWNAPTFRQWFDLLTWWKVGD